MYIWILLATIMVAFSFLNVPARRDKTNIYSELKATMVTTRFRAEHLAFKNAIECDVIKFGGMLENIKNIDENFQYQYSSFTDNLPIGYERDTSLNIKHYLVCLNKAIGSDNANVSVNGNCNGSYRYAVSFMPIPPRWVSKELGHIRTTDDQEYNVEVPIPSFSNLIAKETSGIRNTGWTVCNDAGCQLMGRGSVKYVYNGSAPEGQKIEMERFKFPIPIMANEDFKAFCRVGTPCLFSYDIIKTSDTNNVCTN